ncbi:hypothetical protein [Burkholderia gladioli]|uniref:hypothetical protein n=1 Tax=Burkholderia gladioli TaxID=28095 RepID=UPI00163F9B18|nr:hypothetical protein [Burkholderia gladioli]
MDLLREPALQYFVHEGGILEVGNVTRVGIEFVAATDLPGRAECFTREVSA